MRRKSITLYTYVTVCQCERETQCFGFGVTRCFGLFRFHSRLLRREPKSLYVVEPSRSTQKRRHTRGRVIACNQTNNVRTKSGQRLLRRKLSTLVQMSPKSDYIIYIIKHSHRRAQWKASLHTSPSPPATPTKRTQIPDKLCPRFKDLSAVQLRRWA